MKFEINPKLFPFENRFMELPGGHKLHYVDEGSGPILLMLHGNPTWSFLYRKMIRHLKSHFRCIAPDYPGFGLSEAGKGYDFLPRSHSQVIEAFVKELGIKKITVVVQDWGGPIGLGFAGRNPELIKAAIIGNTWAWPLAGDFRIELFSWFMGGPIGKWMAWSFNGVWKYFMKDGFVNRPSVEEMEMYRAPFVDKRNRSQTAIFPRQLVKAYDYEKEVEAGLVKIQHIPVLLPWGTEDFAFRDAERKRFEGIFKNHETLLLNASHFWQDDEAEKASGKILDWYPRAVSN